MEIVQLGDIFDDEELMSFQGLQEMYGLEARTFIAYGAVCRVVNETWGCGRLEPTTHMGLGAILTHGMGRHAVTILYRALNGSCSTKHLAVKTKWDECMGEISPEHWKNAT